MLYVLVLVLVDLFLHFPITLMASSSSPSDCNPSVPSQTLLIPLNAPFGYPPSHFRRASSEQTRMPLLPDHHLCLPSHGHCRLPRLIPTISTVIIHASQSIPYRIAQMCLSIVYLISFPLILAPIRTIIASLHSHAESFIYNLLESSVFVLFISTTSLLAPSTTVTIADTVGALGNAPIALCLPAT